MSEAPWLVKAVADALVYLLWLAAAIFAFLFALRFAYVIVVDVPRELWRYKVLPWLRTNGVFK